MKRRFLNLVALLNLLIPACGAAREPFRDVEAAEAKDLLNDKAVFLLDVRTLMENTSARIAGDALAPLQTLERELDSLPKDKKRPVLIYCRSGNRSVTAARILAKHGHEKIYNLKGGIIGWQRAGLPVETGPRAKENGR